MLHVVSDPLLNRLVRPCYRSLVEVEALAAEPIVALVYDAAVDEGAFALHGDGGLYNPAVGPGLLALFPQLETDLGGLEGGMVLSSP